VSRPPFELKVRYQGATIVKSVDEETARKLECDGTLVTSPRRMFSMLTSGSLTGDEPATAAGAVESVDVDQVGSVTEHGSRELPSSDN
jgi:hypothetical protein